MKKIIFIIAFVLPGLMLSAQEEPDTIQTLDEVIIRSFEQNKTPDSTAIPVRVIDQETADRYNKSSLLSAFNTIAGVKMEERSPGSFRISIRGSSLRSPFGVRNVKVYWNDIPITDPGGNTYFNQFAYNNFSAIEIFKGPASSLYGAGTGGLIIMYLDNGLPGAGLEYLKGSYGLHHFFASGGFGNPISKNQFTYAHNQQKGYRIHTRMRRDNFSWISQLKFSGKHHLSASVLFTDLYYQTPGALTLTEFNNDPKAARSAAGGFPSAVNARAAISQKNLTVGFTNRFILSQAFENKTTIYGAFAQVKNPAIRNYERRNEPHFGGRTLITWNKKNEKQSWKFIAGSEFQKGFFNTQVSKNKNGEPDTLQTDDDINYTTYHFFLQADTYLKNEWLFHTGISLNKTRVVFSRLNQYPVIQQEKIYRNEFAPNISLKKNFHPGIYLKATVSRGFSPPTIAELLPSTGIISTNLEAEYGWNYEMTAGSRLLHNKLLLEVTGFYFKLNNALVQRRDSSGADFFVNAGDAIQRGIEIHAGYSTPFRLNHLTVQSDFSFNHFRYGVYIKGMEDFSGKKLPSVPGTTLSILVDLQLKQGIYSNATFYTASKIFLNDANTVFTDPYHLLGWRLGWKFMERLRQKMIKINFYAGADNLLNENYSLGNDINAAAGRYYNAAPKRNYYAGISLQWLKRY